MNYTTNIAVSMVAITCSCFPYPAALSGAWPMGMNLGEVEMQCLLTGIFCKKVVMGEGMEKVKHNSITW